MSYSEALSARLVSRWEPVSRNQLLVVLLFFFFNPSVKKSVAKNRSQNFCLAVVETVIYHLPLWRFVIYVSVVCLFSGKLQPRRQMLLLPRPGANKGRENGMIPSVILFFLKIFLFVDFDWPSAAWMKWEWRCSQIVFQREQKPWQLLIYRTLFSFIPELLFFCFSPIKSSRRRYSHCFGRHLTCQVVSFGMFIISFWNTQDELLRTAFKMYNSKHLS